MGNQIAPPRRSGKCLMHFHWHLHTAAQGIGSICSCQCPYRANTPHPVVHSIFIGIDGIGSAFFTGATGFFGIDIAPSTACCCSVDKTLAASPTARI